jgi:hypothetical protein
LVLTALILAFGQQVQMIQGRGELAAFKATVGALRIAFALDHLRLATAAGPHSVGSSQRNPFLLLERRPANYAGEVHGRKGFSPAPGSWIYDADCVCVGYAPIYSQWFDSPSGNGMAWFKVSATSAPFQLVAAEAYTWQNQTMD